jgi:tetratricopeptide (TPR) repeat protein
MAILERQIGEAASAEEHFSAAADLNPSDASYWDELAKTRMQLGMEEEAAAAWQSLLDNADVDDATTKSVLVMQGEAYIAAGETDQAIDAYEAALEVDPSDQNVRERLDVLRGDA